MAAVLGLDEPTLAAACRAASAAVDEPVDIANYNAPDQLVIAGAERALTRAMTEAQQRGARRVVRLKVAGPFHTSLMRPAAEAFGALARTAPLAAARIPVLVNTTARPATAAHDLRAELEQQLTSPVRWSDTMVRCAALALDAVIEVGPGQVLAGLARRALPGVAVHCVHDRASLEATLQGLARLAVA